ncbi:maleate isomerase [Mesorhizobium albiziae]|uniref:Maleate isomerase n=1 Tax=Neomesorhizobium albiziae TaxID=335020 RepID=A0A1I4CR60_9HYPH|nr:ectoine utilization protein EutA [Mesorhizobium albiziae]GLS30983.1 ectoine utilization protein EutA [Mesorhizobium albiziae]SFK83752.1 maleate isomerase [Mesorhizobium albiziae]
MTAHTKPQLEIKVQHIRPELDARPLQKRVGLVILATDHTTEPDFCRMVASDRIGTYVARVDYANPTTPENLYRMQPALAAAAALILPGEELDALCYSCTSASVVIGDAEIERALHKTKPGVPVVTPTAAVSAGLRTLAARRISVLTPYTVETSRPMADYFIGQGFDIDRFTCLGFDDDREMARIKPQALVELARVATAPQSAALFVSCTALRAASVVPQMEAATGRPVVSSNLATAWMCLHLCGETAGRPHLGRLMAQALPAR